MGEWRFFRDVTDGGTDVLWCPCCGSGAVFLDSRFMTNLDFLRMDLGRPMKVTSGFRCKGHDTAVGGKGVHPTGHAVDVNIWGQDAYDLVRKASLHGMHGIGVNQRGPLGKRIVHLDDLVDAAHPRPRIWSY